MQDSIRFNTLKNRIGPAQFGGLPDCKFTQSSYDALAESTTATQLN